MSVLASIRNRAGLLVGVIGVALAVFVLEGLFSSNNMFFTNNDNNVGEIAGTEITYDDFNYKVQEQIEAQKANMGQTAIDDQLTNMIVTQTWNQFISDLVLKKEYKKLGVEVSDDELYELMTGKEPHAYVTQYFSDRQTGKIFDMFADPTTGGIDMNKVKNYAQQMNPEQEQSWIKLESAVKETRYTEKYNTLIKKGIFITNAHAKKDYEAQNTYYNVSYVQKRLDDVRDSIPLTEADLTKYYNAHQNEFKQEESRKIEYVAFDINPSEEDADEVKRDAERIANEFKSSPASEDSSFVVMESDSRNFDKAFSKKGTLSPEIDSLMFNAPIGTVYGPYLENKGYKIAKLIAEKSVPDSVKARHILISTNNADSAKAKTLADSIKKAVTAKNFSDLAKKYSQDPGSKEKGGDLGWFAEGAMVPQFNDACFNGKKGTITMVQTTYGYHIIEILDKSAENKRVQVATIEKNINPSPKTLQALYAKASEFSGKNNTPELFEKAIVDEGLNKRIADNVKESDRTIAGLESPKELVKWAYKAKEGEISPAFELGNKFVVAHLAVLREKGIAPLAQVKQQVEEKARNEKKAEKIAKEFETALASSKTIADVASKMNLSAGSMPNLSFSNGVFGGSREDGVIGATTALKANQLSKPIKGNSSVFVVFVESIVDAPAIKDYTQSKTQTLSMIQNRVDRDVFEALKENANIIDKKAKFY